MSPFSQTLSRLRGALRNLFTRPRIERELDADMRAYADDDRQKVRAGLDHKMRRRDVPRSWELGGIERVKDESGGADRRCCSRRRRATFGMRSAARSAARIHGGGGGRARARDRRDVRDLQRGERCAASSTAVS
jgi:hypothetical protein